MKSWEDRILEQFIPDLAPNVWAVADGEGIVRNETILSQLQDKGFTILFFEDPVEFRFEYETQIRPKWENGQKEPIILLFDPEDEGFDRLPSDLLIEAHQLEFSLGELFPNLDADTLRELPPETWTPISKQANRRRSNRIGKLGTEELALKVIYKIVPELITNEVDLLKCLIDIHRDGTVVPAPLRARLASELATQTCFTAWPIERLFESSAVLWRFLQERWERFLVQEGLLDQPTKTLEIEGPESLAFENRQLWLYVDTLFPEGLLAPVHCGSSDKLKDSPWSAGIQKTGADRSFDAARLLQVAKMIPSNEASHAQWGSFGQKYGNLVNDLFRSKDSEAINQFWQELWPQIDSAFSSWRNSRYPSLHNLTPSPPAMVHHVPKQLLRWQREGSKVALIVLDGLSIAGWQGIKDHIGEINGFAKTESTCFAWLPSLTPVSRQALFGGVVPKLFPDTLSRTDKDGSRWQEFWEAKAGLLPSKIAHLRIDGQDEDWNQVEAVNLSRTQAIGITLSMPDELMHGAKLGWESWLQSLELWATKGFLRNLIAKLTEEGFEIGISADHGNLEAIGSGRINEGVLADKRGQRVRIYTEEILRDKAHQDNDSVSLPWDHNLPTKCFPLCSTERNAFVAKGERIVSHGGGSLDELLVPWVTIRKKK